VRGRHHRQGNEAGADRLARHSRRP
jgi:hypothetical protein